MVTHLRKLMLTAHVISSIGWFGAVAAFLALAIVGVISRDAQIVPAAYIAMEKITWFVIVPLAVVSLLSGIASSLGTNWGLFRYYWVLMKLLMTIPANTVLLIHTKPIDLLAAAAARTTAFNSELQGRQIMMVYASVAALTMLIVATALSVYKPRGLTSYGWHMRQESQ